MTPIRTNKPVFFGDNGEVLKNGFIYIGQPDSDPLDFPKSVTYQDATGSQFAAGQPLRTNSQGQISFNGKAIIALVDGDYSMLVQDFNQVTIKDGYTPLIEGVAESGADQTIIYRSTLANLKQVNVTPGQYVENIGKVSQLDGEGARWLVVSNTGTSGDDVDLIDFANGTQGQRVENQIYANGTGTVVAQLLAINSVTTSKINANAVESEKIASNAVTTEKIADNAVTTAKVNDEAITTAKIAGNALSSNTAGRSKMEDSFVIAPKVKTGTQSTTVTLDDSTSNQAVPVVGLGTGARIINYTITGGALPNLAFQCMNIRSPNTYTVRLTSTGLPSSGREITITVQYIEGS